MAGTTIVDTLDTEEQIEEAKASLDRINGWINSCDSKAGTVLALTGVLLTIIFTNDGMAEMYKVLQNIFPPANFCESRRGLTLLQNSFNKEKYVNSLVQV